MLGLQQVLLLLSSQQIPLFLPQLCLNPQGSRALSIAAPELCLLLVALRQHLQMIFRISWSWCFHMLRAHLRKGPQCLHHYSAFPPVQREFLFPIIGVGEEVGRSRTVSLPGEHWELQ